jgi:hypothetical protein
MRTKRRSTTAERVDVLLARARVSILATHADAARRLARLVGERISVASALAIYCDRQRLRPMDAHFVALHARARMNVPDPAASSSQRALDDAAADDAHSVVDKGQAWIREHIAPQSDPRVRECIEVELAAATTAIIEQHVRFALRLAALMDQTTSPSTAIALYLDRVDVDRELRSAIYPLALARLANYTALLTTGGSATDERADGDAAVSAAALRDARA